MERGGGLLTAAASNATGAPPESKATISLEREGGLLTAVPSNGIGGRQERSATQGEARSQAEVSLPVRVLAQPLNRREELTQTMVGHSDSGTR